MDAEFVIATMARQLVTNGYPIALIFAMSRFKCKRKTMWMMFALIVLIASLINTFLIFLIGHEQMKQAYAAVVFVPSLLFLFFMTKEKPSQLLFNFFTAINAIYFTSILSHFILGGILDRPEELIFLDALIRAMLFSVILYLFVRFLREPYQFLELYMERRSWRILCVIPMLFFCLVMFLGLYPHVRTDNLLGVAFLYIILGFVYFIIYQVFHTTYRLLRIEGDNDTLKMQIQAMERQAEMIMQKDEQVRIYRHDLRHYIADVVTLLKQGQIESALKVLGGLDSLYRSVELVQYCENPIVNAILSFYLQQAQDAGIKVESACNVPSVLPVESAELAMVMANALENAIHACLRLSDEIEKIISVHILFAPQLVVEISNSFDGKVLLDEQGYPISENEEHGIGTRSILTFVEKHQGFIDYRQEDRIFKLRILINHN